MMGVDRKGLWKVLRMCGVTIGKFLNTVKGFYSDSKACEKEWFGIETSIIKAKMSCHHDGLMYLLMVC